MAPSAPILRRSLLAGAALALSAAAPAQVTSTPSDIEPAQTRRGPVAIRDDHLLAQPRLTLPALSPDTVPAGRWTVDVSVLWSSSFAWTQDVPGETPRDRRFLIDGEALTWALTLRRGLRRNVDLGLRVPIQDRGGGVLDTFIDGWHRVFHAPDGARPAFRRDAFRVEGVTSDGEPLSWTSWKGTGLGSLQLDARWRLLDQGTEGLSLALVGRTALPTATGPFARHGLGAGAQLALAAPLAPTTDLYAGGGFTVQDPGPVRGFEYLPARAHGFAAVEWRPWRRLSLIAESNVASRLVRNLDSYPGVHWVVNLEGRADVTRALRLDLGLTENLIDQQSTTDLGFFFALAWDR